MRRSKAFIYTRREVPSDADSFNASYLIRGSFIEKNMAGVYAFLPLGLKVIKKIESIVRDEMVNIEGQEALFNVLQTKELWDETGRWNELDEILYKIKDSRGKELALGPTHEEQITDVVRGKIKSYKDLPISLFQIQTKFRNEPRAKSGLLRGREFIMKDMYSFSADEEEFNEYYEKAKRAYFKIFERCGLESKIVEASGGSFSKYSHEFQVLNEAGEDTIYYCKNCDFAQNKEIAEVSEGADCPKCGGKIEKGFGIEVGNIFPLKNKFSGAMGAKFMDRDGSEKDIIMGCYGIGITRLMATIVEANHDEKGVIWPESVAPYKINLISIRKNDEADKIYKRLVELGAEVLHDDRDEVTAGEKFADSDLIGCPIRMTVSEKSMASGGVEVARREDGKIEIVDIDKIEKFV